VGQCVNLIWEARGAVDRVTIDRGGAVLWDSAPLSGSYQDCPPGPGYLTYNIVVAGPGGANQDSRSLEVIQPAPPTPTPTPLPVAPVIDSFTSNVSEILFGQCVDFEWRLSGALPTQVRLTRNGREIVGHMPRAGYTDYPDEVGKVEYTLQVTSGRQFTQASLLVFVASKSPR
jgi:hypothetical protein